MDPSFSESLRVLLFFTVSALKHSNSPSSTSTVVLRLATKLRISLQRGSWQAVDDDSCTATRSLDRRQVRYKQLIGELEKTCVRLWSRICSRSAVSWSIRLLNSKFSASNPLVLRGRAESETASGDDTAGDGVTSVAGDGASTGDPGCVGEGVVEERGVVVSAAGGVAGSDELIRGDVRALIVTGCGPECLQLTVVTVDLSELDLIVAPQFLPFQRQIISPDFNE
ncbi:hypothetical protein J6590_058922 [Homalodisca vitripennis]|nr:hypothetical protein J6590_058922 [Homalodisca vitripennis]